MMDVIYPFNVQGIRMEIIGDNTSFTSLRPKGKVVYCRGEPHKYWLELQFVDENNNPVSGLSVRLEYRPLASAADVALCRQRGYDYNPAPPPNPPAGVTDSQGLVRFDDLYWATVDVKADAQPLADEMEQRPLGISRNPNSQPVSHNHFRPESRDPKWRSSVQISAEQHGHVHHYVTIGELCDRVPEIEHWKDKTPPRFHFPPEKSLKGTEIARETLEKRHVIEICPFRAWSLVLHDTKDYSLANGYNLGMMADMAYAKGGDTVIKQFFFEQCLDLSTTPVYAEFPSFPHALVVDVPFSQRYVRAVFLDSAGKSGGDNDRPLLDSTQFFYVENAEQVVVSWRGTQEVPDWLTDASFSSQPCPPELAKAGRIHGGFLDAYHLAKRRFSEDFDVIKAALDHGKKLFICGHSLGGALGLTYAAEMKGFEPILYTYGMPRTFTADAVGRLYQMTHYRHVNDSDTITSVPFDANLDNWLYGKFGPLGTTLGFFWTLAAELPAQMAGAYVGEHYWHHGKPVVFFRTTQTGSYEECKVMMNPTTCRRLSYSQQYKVKLFLVPSLGETENEEAKEAQEAFIQEFPLTDIQTVFPRNTNPTFDHLTNPGRHSMAKEYLPFLNNQLLESAWPELKLSRKTYRDDFRQQMEKYGKNSPAEELKRNRMFLSLQDMLDSTLAVTRKLPGGDNALIRFKSVAGEEIELSN
ncbi:lipase family protein [Yersinia aleksiciae]|uniref:lipase family protein n=1 Tax=Yersinia aleksiciae TaxID=263819 RepID=UPI0021BDBB2E|nr:lipase family protein [Yersinia aleksiciae]